MELNFGNVCLALIVVFLLIYYLQNKMEFTTITDFFNKSPTEVENFVSVVQSSIGGYNQAINEVNKEIRELKNELANMPQNTKQLASDVAAANVTNNKLSDELNKKKEFLNSIKNRNPEPLHLALPKIKKLITNKLALELDYYKGSSRPEQIENFSSGDICMPLRSGNLSNEDIINKAAFGDSGVTAFEGGGKHSGCNWSNESSPPTSQEDKVNDVIKNKCRNGLSTLQKARAQYVLEKNSNSPSSTSASPADIQIAKKNWLKSIEGKTYEEMVKFLKDNPDIIDNPEVNWPQWTSIKITVNQYNQYVGKSPYGAEIMDLFKIINLISKEIGWKEETWTRHETEGTKDWDDSLHRWNGTRPFYNKGYSKSPWTFLHIIRGINGQKYSHTEGRYTKKTYAFIPGRDGKYHFDKQGNPILYRATREDKTIKGRGIMEFLEPENFIKDLKMLEPNLELAHLGNRNFSIIMRKWTAYHMHTLASQTANWARSSTHHRTNGGVTGILGEIKRIALYWLNDNYQQNAPAKYKVKFHSVGMWGGGDTKRGQSPPYRLGGALNHRFPGSVTNNNYALYTLFWDQNNTNKTQPTRYGNGLNAGQVDDRNLHPNKRSTTKLTVGSWDEKQANLQQGGKIYQSVWDRSRQGTVTRTQSRLGTSNFGKFIQKYYFTNLPGKTQTRAQLLFLESKVAEQREKTLKIEKNIKDIDLQIQNINLANTSIPNLKNWLDNYDTLLKCATDIHINAESEYTNAETKLNQSSEKLNLLKKSLVDNNTKQNVTLPENIKQLENKLKQLHEGKLALIAKNKRDAINLDEYTKNDIVKRDYKLKIDYLALEDKIKNLKTTHQDKIKNLKTTHQDTITSDYVPKTVHDNLNQLHKAKLTEMKSMKNQAQIDLIKANQKKKHDQELLNVRAQHDTDIKNNYTLNSDIPKPVPCPAPPTTTACPKPIPCPAPPTTTPCPAPPTTTPCPAPVPCPAPPACPPPRVCPAADYSQHIAKSVVESQYMPINEINQKYTLNKNIPAPPKPKPCPVPDYSGYKSNAIVKRDYTLNSLIPKPKVCPDYSAQKRASERALAAAQSKITRLSARNAALVARSRVNATARARAIAAARARARSSRSRARSSIRASRRRQYLAYAKFYLARQKRFSAKAVRYGKLCKSVSSRVRRRRYCNLQQAYNRYSARQSTKRARYLRLARRYQ